MSNRPNERNADQPSTPIDAMKRPPLTWQERRKIDVSTMSVLERMGVKCRTDDQTSLRDVQDGHETLLPGYLERGLYATVAGQRAAALALEFDCFRQTADLTGLR
jgi:hypothetical protein